jgi:hypothetical protein
MVFGLVRKRILLRFFRHRSVGACWTSYASALRGRSWSCRANNARYRTSDRSVVVIISGFGSNAFTPASTRRSYAMRRRDDLTTGNGSNVVGEINIPGTGGEQSMTDGEPAAAMFIA